MKKSFRFLGRSELFDWSDLEYEAGFEVVDFVSEFCVEYVQGFGTGAVSGVDAAYAGGFDSAGESFDIVIALVEEVEAADHCKDLPAGIGLHGLIDDYIRSCVGAAVEYDDPVFEFENETLLVAKVIRNESEKALSQIHLFHPAMF